jgi:hypothetical protein
MFIDYPYGANRLVPDRQSGDPWHMMFIDKRAGAILTAYDGMALIPSKSLSLLIDIMFNKERIYGQRRRQL